MPLRRQKLGTSGSGTCEPSPLAAAASLQPQRTPLRRRGNTHSFGLRAAAGPAVTAPQPWGHLQRCHHHLQWQQLQIQQPQMQQQQPAIPTPPAYMEAVTLGMQTCPASQCPATTPTAAVTQATARNPGRIKSDKGALSNDTEAVEDAEDRFSKTAGKGNQNVCYSATY